MLGHTFVGHKSTNDIDAEKPEPQSGRSWRDNFAGSFRYAGGKGFVGNVASVGPCCGAGCALADGQPRAPSVPLIFDVKRVSSVVAFHS